MPNTSAMRRQAGALTVLLAVAALAASPTAHAALTTVQLRVEGASGTRFEGRIATTGRSLDGGDGTGAHGCGGDSPTALTALADAADRSTFTWRGRFNPDFQDFFVDRIGPDGSNDATASYWSVLVNWRYVAGGCRARLAPGSEVLWAFDDTNRPHILRLSGPAHVGLGQAFTVEVRDGWVRGNTGQDGGPVAGATIGGQTTNADGRAVLRFDTSGVKHLKAERSDAIRSNALDVCVGDTQCQGALPPPGETPRPPRLSIDKISAGDRYARGSGPRILRGRATAGSNPVSLSLRSNSRSRRTFTAAAATGCWAARIAPLAPGRYRLSARQGPLAKTVTFSVARAPSTVRAARRLARRYLIRAQARSGGFGASPHARPAALFTGWATIGLAAVRPDRPSRRALARARAAIRRARPGTTAELERSTLALAGSSRRADRRAVARWRTRLARRQRDDGSFASSPDLTAYGVLALRGGTASQRRCAARSRSWLQARRPPGDVDTAGAVLWALGADTSMTRALMAAQNPDGGFAVRAGGPSNAQSTALAILGLRAAGRDPGRVRTEDGISPYDYLRARMSSSGAIAYAHGSHRTPVWVTAQALSAMAQP